jgi:outer membrane protein
MVMKLKVVVMSIIIALAFYCATAFAQASKSDKIGLINIQKIMMESKAGKEAKASFEKELEIKKATLSNKEKAARAIEEDLKANGAKMKADARRAKEDSFAEQIKDLRRAKQDIEEQPKKKDNDLTSGILRSVLEITKKVGEEGGYSMIMQVGPQVVYASKANDITDEVLRRYDSGK